MFLIKLLTRMIETSPLLDSYQFWKTSIKTGEDRRNQELNLQRYKTLFNFEESSFGQEVTCAFIEPSHRSAWRVENRERCDQT